MVRKQWKRLASRRHQLVKKGNTLNANFRRKFKELQEVMKEETAHDDSVVGEAIVSITSHVYVVLFGTT